jgi:hypothetical protein
VAWARNFAPRTLKIKPSIRFIGFITGGKRFFAGACAGGLSILVNVNMVDAARGEVIASSGFYQQSNAMGAAYAFGPTDKTMRIRISNMTTDYLRKNCSQAVGNSVSVAPHIDGNDTGKEQAQDRVASVNDGARIPVIIQQAFAIRGRLLRLCEQFVECGTVS